MTTRQVTFASAGSTANNNRSYKDYQQSSNSEFKITVSNENKRKEQQRPRSNKPNAVPPQTQKSNNTDVRTIKELSSQHLQSLKNTFNKIIHEQYLSKNEQENYLSIYNRLQKIILDKRPDAQVVLYGSTLFECAVKATSMIDIDVQFNDTLPYETLKELLSILRHSGLCKEAHLNFYDELLYIDVTLLNANIRVRLTSNNIAAIQLSRLIQIYTKFDKRVLPLLRLFRIFSKICHLDQRDEGTLHPIVLHLMVIYFLQQLDPPVLPCLHEYVFGIDKSPVTLINEQYAEFFQVCNEYANRWRSTNTTDVELLFLQLLSYFVRRFHTKRLCFSIKTRMPLLKSTKKPMHNRSLFCADPIYINRNLAYTLKVGCLIDYFYYTLEKALNYFCQTPKSENSYYKLTNYDDETLRKQLVEIIHKSYHVFIEQFPNRNDFWNTIKQEDLRERYKKTFKPLPEPILKLKENSTILLLDDDDSVNEDDDDEEEEGQEESLTGEISRENTNEQIVPNQDRAEIIIEPKVTQEQPISFDKLAEQLDENQISILRKQYNEQARLFNDKMQQILNEIKATNSETDAIIPSEIFYDMQAKNFGADQQLPIVCSICFQMNHNKFNCPELYLPPLVNIPKANRQWANLITNLCKHITDQCKPRKEDTDIRDEIVEYLKSEFGKCYPSCCVHIYGSSQNGFAFRQSDLDICLEIETNNGDLNTTVIFEKLLENLQLKTEILKDIEFIRDARVPIIRSKHTKFDIEIDISLNNILAVENTRLLKTYTQIDPRVSELGYMIKHLVKTCGIGDVKSGTLSCYAYILMLIHFLQQFRPSVLPVLQQLNADQTEKKKMLRECNVYFYDDLTKLKQIWINKSGSNTMSTGELWIEFLRFYTERFDYKNHIVTIRQLQPLRRDEKGWFNPTIAIEDPFILTHNLANKLSLKKWTIIQRVLIRAREGFALPLKSTDIQQTPIDELQNYLFDVQYLCPEKLQRFQPFNRKAKNKQNKKPPRKTSAQ